MDSLGVPWLLSAHGFPLPHLSLERHCAPPPPPDAVDFFLSEKFIEETGNSTGFRRGKYWLGLLFLPLSWSRRLWTSRPSLVFLFPPQTLFSEQVPALSYIIRRDEVTLSLPKTNWREDGRKLILKIFFFKICFRSREGILGSLAKFTEFSGHLEVLELHQLA